MTQIPRLSTTITPKTKHLRIALRTKHFPKTDELAIARLNFQSTTECPITKALAEFKNVSASHVGYGYARVIANNKNTTWDIRDGGYLQEMFDDDFARAQQSTDPDEIIRIIYLNRSIIWWTSKHILNRYMTACLTDQWLSRYIFRIVSQWIL